MSHSKICANLDASKIMTRSLGEFKKEQRKKVLKIEDRKEVRVLNKKDFPNCFFLMWSLRFFIQFLSTQ